MCLSLSNSLLICKCLQIKSVSSTILSFWKLKHPPPTCSLPLAQVSGMYWAFWKFFFESWKLKVFLKVESFFESWKFFFKFFVWKFKHPPPTCSIPRPRSQVCIGRSHDYSGGASRGCFRLSRTLTWLDSGDSPRRSGKMHARFFELNYVPKKYKLSLMCCELSAVWNINGLGGVIQTKYMSLAALAALAALV